MDTHSIRTPYWRSAAPEARHSRLASFKSLAAFATQQVLLFWPPYRVEHEGEGCKSGASVSDRDGNSN